MNKGFQSFFQQTGKLGSLQLAGLSALNGIGGFSGTSGTGAINPNSKTSCRFPVSRAVFLNSVCLSISALAALGTQGHNRPQANQQTHEMTVPNELIGCIIGKGGSKIAEIRYYHIKRHD